MDLDEALGSLARAERAARPEVSERLRARVLADAAEIAACSRKVAERPRRAGGGPGLLDRLRGLDLWAGAAVAAAILCLAVGLGIGYGAGDAVLAGTGLGDGFRLAQADEAASVFPGEDVL